MKTVIKEILRRFWWVGGGQELAAFLIIFLIGLVIALAYKWLTTALFGPDGPGTVGAVILGGLFIGFMSAAGANAVRGIIRVVRDYKEGKL